MALRVAILGTGSWYSVSFARALRELGPERADFRGATHLGTDDDTLGLHTGLTRAGFSSRFDVPVYASAEELLEVSRPNLVFVTAPDREKARYAALALAAGADVYISKPMTSSLAGAAEIRSAASRYPGQLVGALNPARFATAIREAHKRVRDGAIGEVLTARAWIQHGAADPTRSRKGSAEFDDDQGGIEFSLGLYAADLLNWFVDAAANPAVRTFAEYDTLNTPGYPWMDSGKAIVRYRQGKLGSMDIYYSVSCPAPLWEIEVGGRDGILRTNGSNYEGMIWRRGGIAEARIEPFAQTRDDTIHAAVAHTIRCCENRVPLEMDVDDGYRAIELCAAWRESASTHAPVLLPLTL